MNNRLLAHSQVKVVFTLCGYRVWVGCHDNFLMWNRCLVAKQIRVCLNKCVLLRFILVECATLQQRCASLQQDCDSLREERTTLTGKLHRLEAELCRYSHSPKSIWWQWTLAICEALGTKTLNTKPKNRKLLMTLEPRPLLKLHLHVKSKCAINSRWVFLYYGRIYEAFVFSYDFFFFPRLFFWLLVLLLAT